MEQPIITAAGGLVQNKEGAFLLIFRRGFWDLPKGKLDAGETIPDCAVREVQEETGVQHLEIRDFITKTYHVFKQNGEFKLKITYWYEMYSDYGGTLSPQADEGIKKAKWKNFEKSQKALVQFQNSFIDMILGWTSTEVVQTIMICQKHGG